MKKVLSLVLVLAMILGSFSMVFASQYSDVKDTAEYAEAVSVLSGLGVVGGFPDGTFKPEEGVTRAQMATMIVNALGLPVSGSANTKFSDVPREHWASGYIKLAESMGFIAGYTDGTFQPEKKVSYDEAITMLVASLGYSLESLTGTWPGAFVNKANSLGILDLCRKTGDASAPRGDVANLLYKTLTCNIGAVDKDAAWHANQDKDGNYTDTMMKRLGANDYDPATGAPGDAFIVDEDIASEAEINILSYLGAYVTAYANDDNEIIAIKEVKSVFIEGDYDDLKDDYKIDKATVDGDFVLFDNGETAGSTMPTSGDMKLAVAMSGSKAKTIYSAQTWTPAATERVEDDVQEVIEDDHKLCGEKFAEDEDEEIDLSSFAIFGRDALKDIAEDDIVTVYTNKAGEIVRIEVGTKQVEGTITKINAAHTKYTIAGTAYPIADAATGFGYTELNDMMKDEVTATFLLDYAGGIFDYDEEEAETTDGYGIVLDNWDEKVKSTVSYFVEILLADGTTKEYEYDDSKVTAPAAGTLAYYELDEDDVVIDLKPATGTPKTISISKNGVAEGNRFNSSSVVFKYTGKSGDEKKASKYSVIDAATLYDKDVENVIYIVNSSKVVKAAKVGSTVAEADTDLAYFVKATGSTADGNLFTVLYKGKVQELTVKTSVTPTVDKTGATPYTLTMNSSDIVTAVDPGTIKGMTLSVADLDTKGTSVSGSVFTSTDKASYDLDADIVVYLNDDGTWSAKTVNALGAKKGTYTAMTLFDIDDDGDFDQAIITK